MRRLQVKSPAVRFTLDEQMIGWLRRVLRHYIENTVDGMRFAPVLQPWYNVLAAIKLPEEAAVEQPLHSSDERPERTTVELRVTVSYGTELLITTTREAMQPLIDALAIIVDGDQQALHPFGHGMATFAYVITHRIYEWFTLLSHDRAEMRRLYAAPAEQALSPQEA